MLKERIKYCRNARGLTQQNVADALTTGLRNFQKYESGHACPTLDGLVRLAELFNVPTDFLLGRDDYLKSLGVHVDLSQDSPPRHPKLQLNR